jgi:hypothetical protein
VKLHDFPLGDPVNMDSCGAVQLSLSLATDRYKAATCYSGGLVGGWLEMKREPRNALLFIVV